MLPPPPLGLVLITQAVPPPSSHDAPKPELGGPYPPARASPDILMMADFGGGSEGFEESGVQTMVAVTLQSPTLDRLHVSIVGLTVVVVPAVMPVVVVVVKVYCGL